MIKGKIFTVPFRRKREGRTYYKKRLKIIISNKCRLVVRKSLKNICASIVKYSPEGDKVLIAVSSSSLGKLGWKGGTGNLPSAYLTGLLAGKKSIENGIKEAVLDIGFSNSVKGSRLYAALAGALDSGLRIPFNAEVLPPTERISGEHIAKYALSIKSDRQKYETQFSAYLKRGIAPEDFVRHFNETKGKMNG